MNGIPRDPFLGIHLFIKWISAKKYYVSYLFIYAAFYVIVFVLRLTRCNFVVLDNNIAI